MIFHTLVYQRKITNLGINRSSGFKNISVTHLEKRLDVCVPHLHNICNYEIVSELQFIDNLKHADVTPVFKKEDKFLLKDHRPVKMLPVKCFKTI